MAGVTSRPMTCTLYALPQEPKMFEDIKEHFYGHLEQYNSSSTTNNRSRAFIHSRIADKKRHYFNRYAPAAGLGIWRSRSKNRLEYWYEDGIMTVRSTVWYWYVNRLPYELVSCDIIQKYRTLPTSNDTHE